MGLQDSMQHIAIVIVGLMMATRWLEAHVKEELDCLKDLDRFETTCKILNIPMEVKKICARRRLMP